MEVPERVQLHFPNIQGGITYGSPLSFGVGPSPEDFGAISSSPCFSITAVEEDSEN